MVFEVAALLDSEIGAPSLTVHMALPPHWRSIVWAAGIWRAGNVLTLDSDQEAELSLACSEENLNPGAEVSVLTPPGFFGTTLARNAAATYSRRRRRLDVLSRQFYTNRLPT